MLLYWGHQAYSLALQVVLVKSNTADTQIGKGVIFLIFPPYLPQLSTDLKNLKRRLKLKTSSDLLDAPGVQGSRCFFGTLGAKGLNSVVKSMKVEMYCKST